MTLTKKKLPVAPGYGNYDSFFTFPEGTQKEFVKQYDAKYPEDSRKADGIILLGYGDDDRLAPQDHILAEALPPDQVFHVPGGHDWPVWRTLLRSALQHPAFTRSCAAAPPAAPPVP